MCSNYPLSHTLIYHLLCLPVSNDFCFPFSLTRIICVILTIHWYLVGSPVDSHENNGSPTPWIYWWQTVQQWVGPLKSLPIYALLAVCQWPSLVKTKSRHPHIGSWCEFVVALCHVLKPAFHSSSACVPILLFFLFSPLVPCTWRDDISAVFGIEHLTATYSQHLGWPWILVFSIAQWREKLIWLRVMFDGYWWLSEL